MQSLWLSKKKNKKPQSEFLPVEKPCLLLFLELWHSLGRGSKNRPWKGCIQLYKQSPAQPVQVMRLQNGKKTCGVEDRRKRVTEKGHRRQQTLGFASLGAVIAWIQPIVPGPPGFQGQWPLSASAAAVINTSAHVKAGSNCAGVKAARFSSCLG